MLRGVAIRVALGQAGSHSVRAQRNWYDVACVLFVPGAMLVSSAAGAYRCSVVGSTGVVQGFCRVRGWFPSGWLPPLWVFTRVSTGVLTVVVQGFRQGFCVGFHIVVDRVLYRFFYSCSTGSPQRFYRVCTGFFMCFQCNYTQIVLCLCPLPSP